MRQWHRTAIGALVGAALLAGCSGPADRSTRVKTGAEDKAREFFTALMKRDWVAAYQCLDQQSKAAHTERQFAQLAEAYCRSLGFEPDEVIVQSCDERGTEATAHVNLKGGSGTSARYHKDAVGLRHGPSGWCVLLPAKFGRTKPANP